MKLDVKWGSRSYKGDPQKVYEEITSIGNDVQAEQIVSFARENTGSDLHKCFTWDDTVAAEKYRLYEARQIVSALVVRYSKEETGRKEPIQVRVLHRASTNRSAGYKPLEVIVKDKDLYKGLLEEAKAELRTFRNKYSTLSELKQIFELIDALP